MDVPGLVGALALDSLAFEVLALDSLALGSLALDSLAFEVLALGGGVVDGGFGIGIGSGGSSLMTPRRG